MKITNNATLNEIEVLLIRQMKSTIEISTCNFFKRVYSEVAKLVNGACYVFAGFPTKWKVRLVAVCFVH